jgi:hypothetical protein
VAVDDPYAFEFDRMAHAFRFECRLAMSVLDAEGFALVSDLGVDPGPPQLGTYLPIKWLTHEPPTT